MISTAQGRGHKPHSFSQGFLLWKQDTKYQKPEEKRGRWQDAKAGSKKPNPPEMFGACPYYKNDSANTVQMPSA